MNDWDLRDLTLAGIQWELTDIPFVIASAPQAHEPTTTRTPGGAANARTPTAIVPPIAPEQTISVETAVAMAARPGDAASLNRMIAEFNHPLRAGATNVILPHIAPNPNGLVIITDIPSADDDANGQILSGAAGELLDKMLAAIDMSRENVSIVPLLFWRTPGGRTPSREEMDLGRPFVNKMLGFLKPRIIMTLGTLPAMEIGKITLAQGHGIVKELDSGVKLMPLFHPNYLMLKPGAKRDAWNALQSVQKMLKNPNE
ncbi:MAG: uracil-DNA glycosylase [Proteobacteria bacterium]|uniref:Uracil-DNA glycosylase n=1 Tax=Candidatus Enterousia avistercoris TaxID=2840788 RepID=A0A9D9GSI7_9PROT|nr:uracil-DNA glycosylase [Candidatus Enterousia avistercoris]